MKRSHLPAGYLVVLILLSSAMQASPIAPDSSGNPEQIASYRSKFDFIPGEKILLFENFKSDAVGDFPASWNTNGTGEVVTIPGREGQWLMMKGNSNFVFTQVLKLPDNFTIQFDLLCSTPFAWGSGKVHFGIADVKNPKNYLTSNSYNLNSNDNRVFWIDMHPGASKSKSKGYGHYAMYNTSANKYMTENLDLSFFEDSKEKQLVKVSITRQKQRLRVYLNETKMIDLPRVLPAEMVVNTLIWKTESLSGDDRYFIGNVQVAAGVPDTRNRLITEGKLVTNGILFDVNAAIIKPESYGILKEIAAALQENPEVRVKIVGHTDSDGDDKANMELSKRRAAAVKEALARDFQVGAERMETEGKGEASPAVPNTSVINKATNRRVEFIKLK